MSLKEDLIAVRALIADPAHWTQGVIARDAAGKPIQYIHGRFTDVAKSYCVGGAVLVIVGADNFLPTIKAINIQARKLFPRHNAVRVNECIGHAAVMQVLDAALAAAESEEQ